MMFKTQVKLYKYCPFVILLKALHVNIVCHVFITNKQEKVFLRQTLYIHLVYPNQHMMHPSLLYNKGEKKKFI
jgi:hypothetical protein